MLTDLHDIGPTYFFAPPRMWENILTSVEGSLAYIRENTLQHHPERTTHHHGEDDHMAYLERPFIEAREAVHRRMHELGLAH